MRLQLFRYVSLFLFALAIGCGDTTGESTPSANTESPAPPATPPKDEKQVRARDVPRPGPSTARGRD
jgi:hypothetical protein